MRSLHASMLHISNKGIPLTFYQVRRSVLTFKT